MLCELALKLNIAHADVLNKFRFRLRFRFMLDKKVFPKAVIFF